MVKNWSFFFNIKALRYWFHRFQSLEVVMLKTDNINIPLLIFVKKFLSFNCQTFHVICNLFDLLANNRGHISYLWLSLLEVLMPEFKHHCSLLSAEFTNLSGALYKTKVNQFGPFALWNNILLLYFIHVVNTQI